MHEGLFCEFLHFWSVNNVIVTSCTYHSVFFQRYFISNFHVMLCGALIDKPMPIRATDLSCIAMLYTCIDHTQMKVVKWLLYCMNSHSKMNNNNINNYIFRWV